MITYAALDRVLRQLDPIEERIKAGLFEFQADTPDVNNAPVLTISPLFPFLVFPNPNIKVVKTSRFYPVPYHIHSFIEVGYMYSGSCEHTIKDKTYTLTEGQLYILDSDTPHAIGYLGEDCIHISLTFDRKYFNDSFFTRFSKDSILSKFLLNSISKHAYHDNFIHFNSERNRRIPTYVREILCEHLNPSINSVDIIDNYISLLFLELVNIYERDCNNHEIHLPQGNIVPILKYIESNYRTCDLKGTADIFNMNANYLTSYLKKYTGYSFKQLVQRQKFQFINSQLLNTTLPIDSIAVSAGYENTTYFYKKYKEEYGCSPKEFREQHSVDSLSGYNHPDGAHQSRGLLRHGSIE